MRAVSPARPAARQTMRPAVRLAVRLTVPQAVWHTLLLGTAGVLLAGCAGAPVTPQWALAPLLRVNHAGGDQAAALYRVGRYHQQRGETAAAAEAFTRSLALQPDQLDARNAQAVLLAGQGRSVEAIDMLRQLAAAYPRAAQPLNNLGYLYAQQGLARQARAAFEQALALEPLHAQARANLAHLPTAPTPASASAPALSAPVPAPATAASANAHAAAPAPGGAAPLTSTTAPDQPRLLLVQEAPNRFRLEERALPARSTTLATASAPASAPAPAPALALQIVNGNGVRGLAERVRGMLRRHGIAGAAIANARAARRGPTIIEYLPGHRQRAETVRAALDGKARLVAARALPGAPAVRLVLGSDHAGQAARGATRPALRRPPESAVPLLVASNAAAPFFNQE